MRRGRHSVARERGRRRALADLAGQSEHGHLMRRDRQAGEFIGGQRLGRRVDLLGGDARNAGQQDGRNGEDRKWFGHVRSPMPAFVRPEPQKVHAYRYAPHENSKRPSLNVLGSRQSARRYEKSPAEAGLSVSWITSRATK